MGATGESAVDGGRARSAEDAGRERAVGCSSAGGGHLRGGGEVEGRAPEARDDFVPGGIFIRGLPGAVTEEALRGTLEKYARVVKVSRHRKEGFAFAILDDPDVAEELIAGRHGNLKFLGVSNAMPCRYLMRLNRGSGPFGFRKTVDELDLKRGSCCGYGRKRSRSKDGEDYGSARASLGAGAAKSPRAPQQAEIIGERSKASACGLRQQDGGTEQVDDSQWTRSRGCRESSTTSQRNTPNNGHCSHNCSASAGDACRELGNTGASAPAASLQSLVLSTPPRRQLLGATVTVTLHPLSKRPVRKFPLLWRGVLGEEAEGMGAGASSRRLVRRAQVQARHVFGENLNVLLLLENVLGSQTEWLLQGPSGSTGKSAAGGMALSGRERGVTRETQRGSLAQGLDGAFAPDEYKEAVEKAARARALVLCLLEREDSGSEWLDDKSSWYSLKLPEGAGFCAIVLPSQSQLLGKERLYGCTEPLLACWLG